MSRKAFSLTALIGLGVLTLFWAAVAAREEPAPAARPKLRPFAAAAVMPPPEPFDLTQGKPFAPIATPAVLTPEEAANPANVRILERIRLMEEKVRELASKRDLLTASNAEIEKQVREKTAEQSARSRAEHQVQMWQWLGLGETQKQALIDLWARWFREDAGGQAGRDAWLAREAELRARLSGEQAAKVQENVATQAQNSWARMGKMIAGMVGGAKDDHARFQQALGDFRPAGGMILPEAYGADWNSLMREASNRLRPMLSTDQTAKLDRYVR